MAGRLRGQCLFWWILSVKPAQTAVQLAKTSSWMACAALRPSPAPHTLSQWGPVFDEPPQLMRPDWEVLVGAVVDRALQRPEVDR